MSDRRVGLTRCVCLSSRARLGRRGIDWIWETTATVEDERQKACARANEGNVLFYKSWSTARAEADLRLASVHYKILTSRRLNDLLYVRVARNKPLRARERERNRRSNRRIRRLRSERICTTRWRADRFSRRFSHAIETNVLKCTHGRGRISHREISISAFLSTIPRSRTDYPLIRAGQRREVE
ncbi:hypothetical protein PUN28_011650 [Cardiocondyla obscurior]|uniref:Uncharacterized protein n=1 Tax=Cardiocondyla obscurior TaxID=286306 RepID=A0AAW2FGB5_9HYME